MLLRIHLRRQQMSKTQVMLEVIINKLRMLNELKWILHLLNEIRDYVSRFEPANLPFEALIRESNQ